MPASEGAEPGSPLPKGTALVTSAIEYGGHRLERTAHAFLDDLARDVGVPEVATEVVASSTIARTIVRMAADRAVDLIIVGGRGRSRLA